MQVLQGFRIRPKRIVKEKSYYIISTDKGSRVIKKCMDTKGHLLFQNEIKEFLHRSGFKNVDRFYLSTQSTPFFEYDENIYVMTDHFNFKESVFSDNEDFVKIIKTVSEFHKVSANIDFKNESYYGNENLTTTYKKQIIEIETIKKGIRQRGKLSDFDVLFLKNYDHYMELMKESLQLLEKTKLSVALAYSKNAKTISHNLLKEEHLLIDHDKVYITGFSQACIDYQIFDVCAIIQRYAKNLPLEHFGVYDILELYDKTNPIAKEDVEILYPILIYPNKFVKICKQYYAKKRSWTPSAIINRMSEVIDSKEKYENFVNGVLR